MLLRTFKIKSVAVLCLLAHIREIFSRAIKDLPSLSYWDLFEGKLFGLYFFHFDLQSDAGECHKVILKRDSFLFTPLNNILTLT